MPIKNPHPLYGVWQGMRRRCLTPTTRQFKDYGGRGIAICPEWGSFNQFVADMGKRPEGFSLDRIDPDGPYSPENCRWASRKTQQRNQRRTVYVVISGKKYRAIELAEKYGVKTDTIAHRAGKGMPFEMVVARTVHRDLSGLALGGKASGRKKSSKTHCQNGHEFTDKNTRHTKEGWRTCRACHAAREARRRERC